MSNRINGIAKTPFVIRKLVVAISIAIPVAIIPFSSLAAELNNMLNTNIPPEKGSNFTAPISLDIPSQPLDVSLKQFSNASGIDVSFDSDLARNKTAPAVKGSMTRKEALQRLLSGSGLDAAIDGDAAIVRPRPDKDALSMQLETVNVRAKRFYEIGPLPGLGLTKDQIPGNVQSLSAQDIKDSHALSITDLMNSKLQSINVNDYQGNPFQMDVTYRGFTAGPQIGTPQGLAVFFDGIRVNEPFGDVVNWDMIPMNALAGLDVIPGSNPIYGLGALGGAIAVKTKDGFNFPGVDAEVLTGSFGRKQLQASGGWNNGTVALFGAGSFFMEDGWRENSPSEVNQMFGKASYRGEKLDLSLSSLVVWNDLIGNGLLPSEMYKQNRNGVFTSPDTTENRLWQFQLSGSYFVNDNFSITGQVYRRNSKRSSQGADVYTEFEGQDFIRRNLNEGEEYTCLFESSNDYGLPDYYVVADGSAEQAAFTSFANTSIEDAFAAVEALNPNAKNAALPDYYVDYAQKYFAYDQNFYVNAILQPAGITNLEKPIVGSDYKYETSSNLAGLKTITTLPGFLGGLIINTTAQAAFHYTENGVKQLLLIKPPTNADVCQGDIGNNQLKVPGPVGGFQTADGANYSQTNPGVVDGTPTAVLTDNSIDQITDGASIQFNWNTEKHKFMIGASIDRPTAKYATSQQLGLFTANREFYYAPDEIRDQYLAADIPISNNNFEGEQTTNSLYFSETWSPVSNWHFNASARYNDTKGHNKIASRTHGTHVFSLSQLEAFPDSYDICPPGADCPTGYEAIDALNLLNPEEKEEFSYYSLNPSLGVAWNARDDLNIYANFAQGVRVPSVIELGCALDKTPVGPKGIYKSLQENRSCSLPSNLSGDPYLPQIKAETWEIGARGLWYEWMQWNITAYQTNLKDDLYLVTFPGNRNFFDTIGDTRRQGIELGLSGQKDRWGFSVNYALTHATFEDKFTIAGNDNSSSYEGFSGNYNYSRMIDVGPGDRMPGVSLHNLNATVSYQVTPEWHMSLTGVAHSSSYVRGNENNKHRRGVVLTETINDGGRQKVVTRKATTNPGKVSGYMTFNFRTSYQLSSEWRLGLQVNNIFDKEYFTGGQLGRNPFSPSTYGAIGPDGYNHNSLEWDSTNFLAPGAPRAAWISLRYEFDASK